MADQVLTKQKLIDADEDVQALEDVVNGEPGKLVKTRLGREVYTLASVPQINTMTREEVTAAVAPKANKADVDAALSNLSTVANKFYPTLALANADIANLAINQAVNIGEAANGGLWYKATSGATNLTKSPYDLETKLVNLLGLYFSLSSDTTTNSDQNWVTVNKNKLTFHGNQPYLIHPNGAEVKRYPSFIRSTYEFTSGDVLLWDVSANILIKQNINTARPSNYILLIRYSNFEFDSGALVPFLRKNELTRVSFVVVSTATGGSTPQSQRITIRGNRVSFNKVTLFAVAPDGRLLRSMTDASETTAEYVLPDNSVLFWDFYNKTLSVLGNNDDRPDGGIVLLSYKNSMFQDGYLIPYLHTTGQLSIADSLHATTEGRCFTYSDADTLAHQGLTIENQRLWSFSASTAGNTASFAEARIFNAETLEKIGSITHNLGHSATNDYCPENDYMMSSNGEYSPSVLPKIYLIPNWSTKQNDDVVDIREPSQGIITIPFVEYEADGTTVRRQLGGSGCIGCFGEQKHIAYIMTGQFDYTMKFFKVLLGTGTNNFSYPANSSKVDAAKTYWGTYTAASAGEYNGTAKIIGEYTGINYGVAQGLAYHDGKLYFGLTTSLSGMTLSAVEIELMQNGTFRTTKRFAYQDVGTDGNAVGWESEGLCIKDGRYLQVGGYHNGAMMWAIFPLYNEQGGKGIVGETITLPFKCNSLPQISITPTSETTDLYVTNVTKTSFKVLSSSGVTTGTFNWSCKLS